MEMEMGMYLSQQLQLTISLPPMNWSMVNAFEEDAKR